MIHRLLRVRAARRFARTALLIGVGLLLMLIGAGHAREAQAQAGSELFEGIPVVGTISPEAPAVMYTLSGRRGTLLTVQAVGLSDGMVPKLSLLSTAQPLVESDNDPFGLGNDARLTSVVSQDGPLQVMVTGTNGSFAIWYTAVQADGATPLLPGAPVTEAFTSGSPRVFSVAADATRGLSLIVAPPPGQSRAFAAHVYDADGQPVGALFGQGQDSAALLIPPGLKSYLVVVWVRGAETSGDLVVSLGTGISGPTSPGFPTSTPVFSGGNQCVATALRGDIAVNLRGGPDTSFPVVGSIPVGGIFPITGRDASGAWYAGRLPGGQLAWVFSGVVALSGPCQQLQVLATAAPTATHTVTPTATGTQAITATVTTTTTVTATATPTVTATQQVAPPDSDLNDPLNIALDSSASVSDYVSYPDGDVEDRVQYEVTGMSQDPAASGGRARLTITANCTGTGMDQVQFYVGGLTYGCGQTIVDQEVTYDTRYGLVVITAVGGQGTYVQWTLTGNATRIQ